MKINTSDFRIDHLNAIDLGERATRITPIYKSKEDYDRLLAAQVKRLSRLQERLYASEQLALLLIFQAMDAAGKDGAIKHVMSGVNPQGCQVFSYKQPSHSELQHDFLWRFERDLPERGRIGIFNRSYYEEVLIARVHPELLRSQEHVDPKVTPKTVWKDRYRSIRHFEEHLGCNGTLVLKFYLHISKEEQRRRFLRRIDDPNKNWKLSLSDMQERKYWGHYMKAYQEAIQATGTKQTPWHVVPADDKETARLIVSEIIAERLERLALTPPKVSEEAHRQLAVFREELEER